MAISINYHGIDRNEAERIHPQVVGAARAFEFYSKNRYMYGDQVVVGSPHDYAYVKLTKIGAVTLVDVFYANRQLDEGGALEVIIYQTDNWHNGYVYIYSGFWQKIHVWSTPGEFATQIGHSMDVHRDKGLVAIADAMFEDPDYTVYIRLTVSQNRGRTWGEPITIYSGYWPDCNVAISPSGETIFVVYGGSTEPHEYVAKVTKDNMGKFTVVETVYTSDPRRPGYNNNYWGDYDFLAIAALDDEHFVLNSTPYVADYDFNNLHLEGSFTWVGSDATPWIPELRGAKKLEDDGRADSWTWCLLDNVESGTPTQILPMSYHNIQGVEWFTSGSTLTAWKYWQYHLVEKTVYNDHWILVDSAAPHADGSWRTFVVDDDPSQGVYVMPWQPSCKIWRNGSLVYSDPEWRGWNNWLHEEVLRTDGKGNWVATGWESSRPGSLRLMVSRDDAKTWKVYSGPEDAIGYANWWAGGVDIYRNKIVVAREDVNTGWPKNGHMRIWIGRYNMKKDIYVWTEITDKRKTNPILIDTNGLGRKIDTCFMRRK